MSGSGLTVCLTVCLNGAAVSGVVRHVQAVLIDDHADVGAETGVAHRRTADLGAIRDVLGGDALPHEAARRCCASASILQERRRLLTFSSQFCDRAPPSWSDVCTVAWPEPQTVDTLDTLDTLVKNQQGRRQGGQMSDLEIDGYLAGLDEPKRTTLSTLRTTILGIIPEAEQCISYGMPAFKLDGRVIAGFAAFKNHLSYLPHSGSVLTELSDDLASYSMSNGALRFPIDEPLPETLVEKLIAVRIRQLPER